MFQNGIEKKMYSRRRIWGESITLKIWRKLEAEIVVDDDVDDESRERKADIAQPSVACCECGVAAVMKLVGPRNENRGLRYLCCHRFVFFGKKRNHCRFFE